MFQKRIHVFKAGDQTSAQGVQRHFSEKDLQQVVDTYDPTIHEAPLVIGHAGDNDSMPAYGWIKGFAKQGGNLYADVAFTDTAKDLVKDGHYRKVSISFYSPDSGINPHKGKWSARHLALLGASPPAVKGLEPFSFSEVEGVYDFAVALAPSDIFDEELGPTLIVEKSPLEMLREKLDAVREDMSGAVKELQGNQQGQLTEQTAQADGSAVAEQGDTAQMANPDAPQFKEQNVGREGTEIAQQTADLEDQFPEEEFMDQGKISRKHAKGAHGQVMQVVENVYEEADEKKLDEKHGEMPAAFKKKAEEMKAKAKGKKEEMSAEHGEDEDMTDTGVMKRHGGDGGPGSADHAEGDEFGRMETARSNDDGYGNRMKTGKAPGGGNGSDRMKTAKSSEQDNDRLNTPESSEQDNDRLKTAKASESDQDGDRWAGQADGYDQARNNDQYDAGLSDYPDPNKAKISDGTDPYGREETETKIPTETEEMPDNEVFAVQTTNVMSDKNMRVLRQTSSQGRQAVKGGAIPAFAEQDEDELSEDHGEGAGKPSKDKQLVPGAMDSIDDPAETVGPSGAYAESYKGEKKASGKQLTPGAMDEVDDPAEIVGPDGAHSESKRGKGKLLTPGAQGSLDDPAEITKKSGGVYAEEHSEGKKDPYTKTGFGSTYDEGEGDQGVDEGEEDYNELSVDHCGMDYGMGSMGNPRPMGLSMGMAEQMKAELDKLKAEHAELQRMYMEKEIAHRKGKIHSFVESLYEEGRLTDGVMPQDDLISYCEGLEFGTMEFSEGETAATKLLGLLSKLPPMVAFGEVAGGTFAYAEEADLDPHARALKMVEESNGELDYVECLKRTMFS